MAQSLLLAKADVERFRAALAWRLRWWLLTLPAGIGWATLGCILRLWCFFPPARSGVWSAGNGPCMRAPLIGAHYASDTARRHAFVDASTLLTHRDPRALSAARAVADVAAAIACGEWAQRPSIDCLLARLRESGDDVDWRASVAQVGDCLRQSDPVAAAATAFGSRAGISGYVLQTVPFALVVWHAHHGDFARSIIRVIRAGGDTDTVAAIQGKVPAPACAAPDGGPYRPVQWERRAGGARHAQDRQRPVLPGRKVHRAAGGLVRGGPPRDQYPVRARAAGAEAQEAEAGRAVMVACSWA